MDANDRGFTLIELMIAMMVGMVALAAVSALYTIQSKHLVRSEQIAELHQNARIAMDMMIREINMAGYNQRTDPVATPVPRCTDALITAGTPCVGITNAGANTISFSTDINSNGDIAAGESNPNENIVYDVYSSGGIPALGRTSNGTKNPMVDYVDSLTFQYYDDDEPGNITTSRENIRRLKVTVRVRSAKEDPNYADVTYGDHYRRYTLSSFAFPRNLAFP